MALRSLIGSKSAWSAGVIRLGVVGVLALSTGALAATPPASLKKPVTDEYHGTKVVDEYRWLEDWNDPAVKAWSDAQNAYARSQLDKVACAPALRARLTELENSVGVEYHGVKYASGRFFASKSQPPKQQSLIVTFSSLENPEAGQRVLVDPNELDKNGGTSVDWFMPSPDGELVAISMSEGGSESGNVHVYKTDSGEELKDNFVPRVNGGTAGGWLAWNADASGFFYTRYPRGTERPKEDMDFYTQVYFHALDTRTDEDRFEVGKDYPKIAEIAIEVSPNGSWVLTNVQNGDGGEFIQDIRSPDGKWTRLSTWDDRIVEAKFGHDNAVYLVSRKGALNGKVLRLPLTEGQTPTLANAKQIVPERERASISTDFANRTGIYLTKSRLYVQYQVGGPNELRAYDLTGEAIENVAVSQPAISTMEDIEPLDGDDMLVQIDSYQTPPAYYRLVAEKGRAGELRKTALVVPTPPKMPKLQVERTFATSKDGTQVPLNIISLEGFKPDPKNPAPTVIWGYGGYGVNETPGFSRRRVAWVEQGCVFAVANIRGGGEYGEKWHLEGNLTKKQNVFDDYYAAAKLLIDKGYTSKDKLAIMGGSNGGLLMGATFTQHPDLCAAVVSSVGIYDMLRVELSSNGAFNITEFGTVTNPEHFKALYAYSPYHNVKDGTKYPAILFMTGANDPRVDPMQSRKMTARLQAADPSGLFLLRTSGNTGHGAGTPLSARIEQSVDMYGFLFDRLGAKYGDRK